MCFGSFKLIVVLLVILEEMCKFLVCFFIYFLVNGNLRLSFLVMLFFDKFDLENGCKVFLIWVGDMFGFLFVILIFKLFLCFLVFKMIFLLGLVIFRLLRMICFKVFIVEYGLRCYNLRLIWLMILMCFCFVVLWIDLCLVMLIIIFLVCVVLSLGGFFLFMERVLIVKFVFDSSLFLVLKIYFVIDMIVFFLNLICLLRSNEENLIIVFKGVCILCVINCRVFDNLLLLVLFKLFLCLEVFECDLLSIWWSKLMR